MLVTGLEDCREFFAGDATRQRALLHPDGEEAGVLPGQAVYIPPGAVQYITNTGGDDLVFLCIVDPAWRAEDEEIL